LNPDLERITTTIIALISLGTCLAIRTRKGKKRIHRFLFLSNLSLLAYSISLFILSSYHDVIVNTSPKWLYWALFLPLTLGCYVGLTSAVTHWFHIAASYSGNYHLSRGWRLTVSYLPSAIVSICLLTGPLHGMTFENSFLHSIYDIVDPVTFISDIIFVILALKMYIKTSLDMKERLYKRQSILMTIAGLIPVLGGIFWFLPSFISNTGIIILAILFQRGSIIIANILLAYAILYMNFMDVLPIALREIFQHMTDAVIVLDRQERILQSNPAAIEIIPKLQPGEKLSRFSPEMGAKVVHHLEKNVETHEFEFKIGEVFYWSRKLTLEIQGKNEGSILILTDISERKRMEERLAHAALHDRLTGLPNRTLLLNRLQQVIARTHREEGFKYAVLFLDLDRFKLVNDSLGHQAGDQLLTTTAERLRTCLREVDTIARLGGDEFVILLEDIGGIRTATEIAMRIQNAVSQPIDINGHEVITTSSIGIAMGAYRYHQPDLLLRDADIAMYQAKEEGKSRYVVFDKEMHTQVAMMLQVETDLRKALPANEFDLQYQPILSLRTNQIVGFEALLRWHHPKRGLLLPESFLREAEVTGMIRQIGSWVIQKACQDLAYWQSIHPSDPPLLMCINLSRSQLLDTYIIDYIKKALYENHLPSSSLVVEISENMIIQEDLPIFNVLTQLKNLGVQISVDDFGTGFSTLHILPIYPIDAIKIDRSFTRKISHNSNSFEVVRSIITLGKNLKKKVIVEGIETAEELVKLQTLNCEEGQGFYFHKPLTSDRIETVLAQEKQKIA
jgi:diguanylate cyclase (GGDEF)-like protein